MTSFKDVPEEAESIISAVLQLRDVFLSSDSEAMSVFHRLVHLVTGCTDQQVIDRVLANPDVRAALPVLRPGICALETRAETDWSGQLTGFQGHASEWVPQRYRDLVAQELLLWRQVDACWQSRRRIVFVGAGPLPLTALELHRQSGLPVVALEKDPGCAAAAAGMVAKSGCDGVQVLALDGTEFQYADHDFILVASLVPDKKEVLARMAQTAPQAVVGVRSAAGLGQLLYQAVPVVEFAGMGWHVLGQSEGTSTVRMVMIQRIALPVSVYADAAVAAE